MRLGTGLGLGVIGGGRRFTPKDLGDCVLWLEADTGITLAGSDVATWADQSGNGFDMTAASNRPAYSSDFGDGYPAIDFAAASTERLINAAALFDPDGDFTVMILYRFTGDDDVIFGLSHAAGANDDWAFIKGQNTPAVVGKLYDGSTDNEWTAVQGANSTWQALTFARTGGTAKVCVNGGAEVDRAVAGGAINPNYTTLGALNNGGAFILPMNGQIRAVAAYSAFKASAARDQVRAFWRGRWPSVPA